MKHIKNYIAIFTIIALLFTQSAQVIVWAEEVPTAPINTNEAPATPGNTNTAPDAPTAPTAPNQGQTTATPTPAPTQTQSTTSEQPAPTKTPEQQQQDAEKAAAIKAAEDAWWAEYNKPKTGTVSNGNVGDTALVTGDATNGSSTATSANTNAAVSASPVGAIASGSEGAVVNSGNGVGSTNSGTSSSVVDNTTNQTNGAYITNNADQSSTTGDNSSSGNVGNTIIKTGDANTSATAITNVNTNVDGVMVSEFNIADDHKGDIVLDAAAFAANCISGCPGVPATVKNTANGAYSDNNATSSSETNKATTQNNDAVIGNNMNLSANSGTNDVSFNTGGDNIIYTGDSNVSANSLTFANNNIQGNVTYGVVNIYGNLEGDIILPEFSNGNVGSNATTDGTVANTSNGTNSTNNATANSDINNTTNQYNDAIITNDLVIDAETGNNSAGYTTDGDGTIKTGNTTVDANVVNIANTNINGGTWWLVFINQAGNWIGKLVGSPDGSEMAGSEGTEFTVDADGQVSVSNNGNGAGSTNNAATSNSVNNTTDQNNTANIHNTLNLSANTGGNNANYNTGGSNNIITGDANVVANIVNFVNNNIVGNGTLAVTFVNVFGNWVGDFVAPGQQKQNKSNDPKAVSDARGGVAETVNETTNKSANTTVNVEEEKTVVYEEDEDTIGTVTSKTGGSKTAKSRNVSVASNGGSGIAYNGTYVAGANTVAADESGSVVKQLIGAESKKVLNVNLAYIVLIIPLFLLAIITKKLVFNKLLMKKN